jgi:flagellar assembly protein FliH
MSSSPRPTPGRQPFQLRLPVANAGPVVVLEEARAAARAQGYAAGWAAGNRQVRESVRAQQEADEQARRDAEAERSARLERALAAVAGAARSLEQRIAPVALETDEEVLRAAVALARVLLGRELALATQPGMDALRRAIVHTPANRPVTVWLCPADLATLTDGGPAARVVDGREVVLLADSALLPGEAVAECDAIRVDARLSAALQRLDEVLT